MKTWIATNLPHWRYFVLPLAIAAILIVKVAEMSYAAAIAVLALGALQCLISWPWGAK